MGVDAEEVQAWGLDVALALDRLVDGDLAGMFDGPTTDGIDLDASLIVFDLSRIDRNSVAMPILMAVVGVWLEHTWLRPDRCKRILLVEEAWHIIDSPSVAKLFQRLLEVRPATRAELRRRRAPPVRPCRRLRRPAMRPRSSRWPRPGPSTCRRPMKPEPPPASSGSLAGPSRSSRPCRRASPSGTSTATSRSSNTSSPRPRSRWSSPTGP